MVARDTERQSVPHGYRAYRRYVLENRARHKRGEMLVRIISRGDGSMQFEIESQNGWSGAMKHVVPALLQAEIEAMPPGIRESSQITSQNYTFEMVGIEAVRDRLAYVISMEPKTANKGLIRGIIWVDAEDYAITRIEGEPSKTSSIWLRSGYFVHEYDKQGQFWLPLADRYFPDFRSPGTTEIRIEYFDHELKDVP